MRPTIGPKSGTGMTTRGELQDGMTVTAGAITSGKGRAPGATAVSSTTTGDGPAGTRAGKEVVPRLPPRHMVAAGDIKVAMTIMTKDLTIPGRMVETPW